MGGSSCSRTFPPAPGTGIAQGSELGMGISPTMGLEGVYSHVWKGVRSLGQLEWLLFTKIDFHLQMETFMCRWKLFHVDRDSPEQTEAHSSQLHLHPGWAKLGTTSPVPLSSPVPLLSWFPLSSPVLGGSLPLSQGSPQHSHGRTYWDPRKPSWGGAGPRAGQEKPRISSLLPLSPPHRTEEPGGLWHCPSCPPAPQSWGVCCSQRAAQKGAKRERDLSKSIPETALDEKLARTDSGKGSGTGSHTGTGSPPFPGAGHGPIPAPPARVAMTQGRWESPGGSLG